MSAFSAIDIARTGVGFSHYWMDTVAHNLANVSTVRPAGEEPFRARLVVAQQQRSPAGAGAGVQVAGIVENASDPARVSDPDHPLADEDGYVTQPVVDMSGQMADLMVANRTYQANLRAIQSGREAYETALRIGRE